tara:strand:- start:543 stop:866 length:324 start_codon:yes stop_codon:yes gene_type:complete
MKDKKQGRKFNREKWDWDELDKIKPSNDEIVKRFESFLEEQEAKGIEAEAEAQAQELEQGRSRSRREEAEKVLSLALVLGGGFVVGWWAVILVIKVINLINLINITS